MSFSSSLDRLADAVEFPGLNRTKVRWGQLIRASASLTEQQSALMGAGRLCELDQLGTIRGGIVTRANAYFLVKEIPFNQIPARMRVTRADFRRIAVVTDGVDFTTKIERAYLKPVIKGPESLESAFGIKRSDLRLFDVRDDKKDLEKHHANGALSYLRRGETFPYKTSDDDLKGGIPAQRSQIKGRKPFWYSLQGEQLPTRRIVFPEHIDRRYVFTLVPAEDESVVIDKLYLFEPFDGETIDIVHAALNSLLTWYQVELRGRSQLGQGVLELKIPDFEGIVVLKPDKITTKQRSNLLNEFSRLPCPGAAPSLNPEATLQSLEHGLRALAGERSERRLSVADAKLSRRKMTNVAASIDAYATRLAASMDPHPDPRTFMEEGAATENVSIAGEVSGPLEIGVELFNQGEVLAGGQCVARAGTAYAAQFVRGVLLVQPDLAQVAVPTSATIERTVEEWLRASRSWHKLFVAAAKRTLIGIEDRRTRQQIEQRALRLLHAI